MDRQDLQDRTHDLLWWFGSLLGPIIRSLVGILVIVMLLLLIVAGVDLLVDVLTDGFGRA